MCAQYVAKKNEASRSVKPARTNERETFIKTRGNKPNETFNGQLYALCALNEKKKRGKFEFFARSLDKKRKERSRERGAIKARVVCRHGEIESLPATFQFVEVLRRGRETYKKTFRV